MWKLLHILFGWHYAKVYGHTDTGALIYDICRVATVDNKQYINVRGVNIRYNYFANTAFGRCGIEVTEIEPMTFTMITI